MACTVGGAQEPALHASETHWLAVWHAVASACRGLQMAPVSRSIGLSQNRPSMQLRSVKQGPPAIARGAHVHCNGLGRHAVVAAFLQEASAAAACAWSSTLGGVQLAPGLSVPWVM